MGERSGDPPRPPEVSVRSLKRPLVSVLAPQAPRPRVQDRARATPSPLTTPDPARGREASQARGRVGAGTSEHEAVEGPRPPRSGAGPARPPKPPLRVRCASARPGAPGVADLRGREDRLRVHPRPPPPPPSPRRPPGAQQVLRDARGHARRA